MNEPDLNGAGPEEDALARTGALAIALGRIALGLTIVAFTRRALAGLGFAEPSPGALALARLAGGRDVAMGLQALSVADDPEALKRATAIGAGVDAFKIEGRQRSRAYVRSVVSAFRQAVDQVLAGGNPELADLVALTEGQKQTEGAFRTKKWR